jgi:rhodanese-related sulfurtransferase
MFIVSGALISAGGRSDGPAQETSAPDMADVPLTSEQLAEIIATGDPETYLVDVRTQGEYNAGAIPSAINIPYDVIADRLPTEDRSDRIIVYCRSGNRSSIAASTLKGLGFTNVVDFGGVYRWEGELEVRQ